MPEVHGIETDWSEMCPGCCVVVTGGESCEDCAPFLSDEGEVAA